MAGSAVAAVLAVCLGAGCGGTGPANPGAASPGVTHAMTTVPGGPRHMTPLRAVQQASIVVPTLSWLTFYHGFVWVKRDDGFIARIDPRTDKPAGQVGAYTDQQHYCQGIGAGGGAVWSCSGSSITRIDPGRMKIVATIAAGKIAGQGRLVFAAGHLWVITGRTGDQLTGIDAATNRPGPVIKLPAGCGDLANLAPGTGAVWVECPSFTPGASRIVKVNVARRTIQGTLALTAFNGFATPTDLWAGSDRGLVRVDAQTLQPVALFTRVNTGLDGDVAVDGDRVWVRSQGGFLYRLDARSDTVTEQVRPDGAPGGGSVLLAAGSIWTTADDISNLLRLRTDG
jgi:streptogramin lyase